MLTPLGEEIPLYVDSSGYLGLRVHSTADAKFDPRPLIQTRAKQVGFLSNDCSLWHAHTQSSDLSKDHEWLLPDGVLRSLYLNHSDRFWTAE
jgi:hypothetical protein